MDYRPGTFGYEANGRRLRILDSYIDARAAAASSQATYVFPAIDGMVAEEAMSTSDFPTYIASFSRHTFFGRYSEVSGAWSQYTKDFSVVDFEDYTASRFGRFPDIPVKPLNGPYEQMAIRELSGPTYSLIEYGASWALTRQLVLSDRLNKFSDLSGLAGDAMARTVSKAAVAKIEANPNLWDGVALFAAGHGNIGSTALTADVAGANLLKVAFDAIDNQLDPEGYKVVNATSSYTLLIPRALRWIAEALRDRDTLPLDVTSGTSLLRANEVKGRFSVVEEPYFTDTNNWYVYSDAKGETGFLGAITLNGNKTPFIGLKDPAVRGILGGDDPYSFDFDEIEYKVRHDFAFVPLEYRSVYGAIVA